MSKFVKYLIFFLLFVIAIGAAWYAGFKSSFGRTHIEENQELVLDRVKKVTKLVAVEGYFSELYDYKDHRVWDISFLRKKAMMRVKAKVSVGFDFDSMTIETNENTRQIIIDDFPAPTVIAVDHEIDYFDIDEGIFNSFSEKDYNQINKKAKDFIRKQALDSQLRDAAFEREEELKEMMKFICQSMGWELIIKEKPMKPPYSG